MNSTGAVERSARKIVAAQLTFALKIPCLAQHQQVVKRKLRVVHTFNVFPVTNPMTRNFERLTHSVQVKADDSWGQSYGGNATLRRQPSHSRFTDLQVPGKLFRC